MVTFLVVGDLHGDIPKIHTSEFDAILAPGDFCGDGIRKYILKYLKKQAESEEEVDFDDICSEKIQEKEKKISLKQGRKVLEKLNSCGKPVFIVPGNWDPYLYQDGEKKDKEDQENWKKLKEGLDNIVDVMHTKKMFKGIQIVGHGATSAPESMVDLDMEDDMMSIIPEFKKYNRRVKYFQKAFKKLTKYLESEKPTILMSHNVPHESELDLVINPGTVADGKHYGSVFARLLIEHHQPLLCVGGHIHEGYGETKIRKTVCVNAGFGGDVNTLITINPKEKKVTNVEFLGNNKQNL